MGAPVYGLRGAGKGCGKNQRTSALELQGLLDSTGSDPATQVSWSLKGTTISQPTPCLITRTMPVGAPLRSYTMTSATTASIAQLVQVARDAFKQASPMRSLRAFEGFRTQGSECRSSWPPALRFDHKANGIEFGVAEGARSRIEGRPDTAEPGSLFDSGDGPCLSTGAGANDNLAAIAGKTPVRPRSSRNEPKGSHGPHTDNTLMSPGRSPLNQGMMSPAVTPRRAVPSGLRIETRSHCVASSG